MTLTELKDLANIRTERKGKQLDLDSLLTFRLQEFCRETHFYWRRKTASFNTVAGTAIYDLSSANYGNAGDLEELISVKWVESATLIHDLTPIFDNDAIEELIEATDSGQPSVYTIDPGTQLTLRLGPIPAAAYKIRFAWWAIPNPTGDSSDDVVPLVPAIWHKVVCDGLVADIWRDVYGEASPKYTNAQSNYMKGVSDAVAKNAFAVDKELQFISGESAVRSTS